MIKTSAFAEVVYTTMSCRRRLNYMFLEFLSPACGAFLFIGLHSAYAGNFPLSLFVSRQLES